MRFAIAAITRIIDRAPQSSAVQVGSACNRRSGASDPSNYLAQTPAVLAFLCALTTATVALGANVFTGSWCSRSSLVARVQLLLAHDRLLDDDLAGRMLRNRFVRQLVPDGCRSRQIAIPSVTLAGWPFALLATKGCGNDSFFAQVKPSAMRIALASDHAALDLKAELSAYLTSLGHDVADLGPDTADRVDYPDYGYKLAEAVASGGAERAVALCGSGIGISIAVNRHPALRCALVSEPLSAALAREHNDANALAMGARLTGVDMAKACLDAFLSTSFGGGRHAGRVDKLSAPKIDIQIHEESAA